MNPSLPELDQYDEEELDDNLQSSHNESDGSIERTIAQSRQRAGSRRGAGCGEVEATTTFYQIAIYGYPLLLVGLEAILQGQSHVAMRRVAASPIDVKPGMLLVDTDAEHAPSVAALCQSYPGALLFMRPAGVTGGIGQARAGVLP